MVLSIHSLQRRELLDPILHMDKKKSIHTWIVIPNYYSYKVQSGKVIV
ncbi:hypothetical protein [Methanosarcina horonobensis]|nr:hypothetical protein [Methanosarcina horonobensis]